MSHESFRSKPANLRLVQDLCLYPHAQSQNELEFVRREIPAIVIAQVVSREIVIRRVRATCTMRKHVISMPSSGDFTAADVAPAVCLPEDVLSLGVCQRLALLNHLFLKMIDFSPSKPQGLYQPR